MPSKRTNDSVDRILEELSHEQAERGIRDSVTDRQVDAILQSLGHGSMEESSGGGSALGPIQKEDLPDITLGKGNNFNTEDRFSTAVLDDLLGDLPSMQAAKKNKPGPAAPARRPASVPEPRRMPEVEPKVEKQNPTSNHAGKCITAALFSKKPKQHSPNDRNVKTGNS